MAVKRSAGPYIWVTWLSKLLVGDSMCEWAGWFKSQHESQSWSRVATGFNQARWMMEHTDAVRYTRERLETEGYRVWVESQNLFKLRGRLAVLSGKPDLISRQDHSGSTGTIIDVKTGTPQHSDVLQVMLYMFAVPRAHELHKGVTLDGKVVYNNGEVEIPASAIDEEFVARSLALIKRLASVEPAARVPSAWECSRCEISLLDCPERRQDAMNSEETTDIF